MKSLHLTTHCFFTAVIFAVPFIALSVSDEVQANPTGAQVVGGSVTIIEKDKRLDIKQRSQRAVIDWRSFDIALDEHTQFHQPSAAAITLNRVNSADPSRIAGQLSANGNIVLVNPNGVFFSGTARVDVNGIVATTANINNLDFMAGSNRFDLSGNPSAEIVNEGLITAKEAGLVALVAPNVINNGIIMAKLGRVQLSSADTLAIDFYGDGLLQIQVKDEALTSQLVVNNGLLSADGGKVAMTAAAARDTINSLIVADGVIGAQTIAQQAGSIIIGAAGANQANKSGDSYVVISGLLDASGRDANEQGGSIQILADHISTTKNALLDASGHSATSPKRPSNSGSATLRDDKTLDNGVRSEAEFLAQQSRAGGTIKIGGDYLGKGNTQTAKTVTVTDGSYIFNDAIVSGDAGRTIIWSDEITDYAGLTFARGGQKSGHGGFLETSGKQNLKANGYVDLSSRTHGYNQGTYLLDPDDIIIYGNVDPSFTSTAVSGTSAISLTDNLKIWLDASDGRTILDADGNNYAAADGTVNNDFSGGVATWADKSNPEGSGNDATGTSATVGDINGNTSIRFTNDLMTAADAFSGSISEFSTFFTHQENRRSNNRLISFSGAGAAVSVTASNGVGSWKWRPGVPAINKRVSLALGPFAAGTLTLAEAFKSITVNKNGLSLNGGQKTRKISGAGPADTTEGLRLGSNALDHELGELIAYDKNLKGDERRLILQYQSAKWGADLTRVVGSSAGSSATEAEQAMADDGYGVFTTRYLERLSETADIVLRAENSIMLDLKGDTMSLTAGKSINLTTNAGDINDLSPGTVRTDNGNITLRAGGTGNIILDSTNLEALNSGVVDVSGVNIVLSNINADNIKVKAAADVTLNNDLIASSSAADALQISAGADFINASGSNSALQTASSNWVVYSNDPVGNKNNGLLPDQSLFNQTNIAAAINATADNNLFAYTRVLPPQLTYTVFSNSVEYGEALSAGSISDPTGLLVGDTIGTIGQTGALSTISSASGYIAGTDVGSFTGDLTATAGSLANVLGYTYEVIAGDLTVTKANLLVSADDLTREYGAANAFTATYTGFKLGEDASALDTVATLSTGVQQSDNAGTTGAITVSGGSDTNYNFTGNTSGTLAVTKADLIVSANDLTREYGAANALSATYTGFKLGEDASALDTVATLSTGVQQSDDAGTTGAITVSGGNDTNYNFTGNTSGTLSVSKADLNVSLDAGVYSRNQGVSNPAFDIIFQGLKLGENATFLDTAPWAITDANPASLSGKYVVSLGGGADNNYNFSYGENAVLEVLEAIPSTIELTGLAGIVGPNAIRNTSFSLFQITEVEDNALDIELENTQNRALSRLKPRLKLTIDKKLSQFYGFNGEDTLDSSEENSQAVE